MLSPPYEGGWSWGRGWAQTAFAAAAECPSANCLKNRRYGPQQQHAIITRREQEAAMAKLTGMTIEALIDLRERVEEALLKRQAELQRQIERIAGPHAVVGGRGGRSGSALRGTKVSPKYRSPSGDTWAGRGAKPRWLVAAIRGGKKPDDFLIDKSARKGRRKRRSKR